MMVKRGESIVVIVADTLRKDYGDRYLWPVLKQRGFKKFDWALTTSPWTIPAHASMFTGLYPLYHGAHHAPDHDMSHTILRKKPTIVSKLKDEGYFTVLLSENALISPVYGYNEFDYAQNFDYFDVVDRLVELLAKERAHTRLEKALVLLKKGELGTLARAFLRMVAGDLKKRFGVVYTGIKKLPSMIRKIPWEGKNFLFINVLAPHEPYKGAKDVKPLEALGVLPRKDDPGWRKGYDYHTRFLAQHMERLIHALDTHLNHPKIIVTSDHGQLLGEGNRYGHGVFLDDVLLRVPLYIRGFSLPKERGWFSLKDVYTILHPDYPNKLVVRPWALAEVFGTGPIKGGIPDDPNIKKKVAELDTYRIAVYYREKKAIFNVTRWRWETEATQEHRRIVMRHLSAVLP